MDNFSDQNARAQALDIRQSCLIHAPAGSGKTTLLVQRYLRLLLIVDHPRNICITTFSVKAAAEIRSRIHAYLSNDSAEHQEPALTALLQKVRAHWQAQHWAEQDIHVCTLDALAYAALQQPRLMVGCAATFYRAAVTELWQALVSQPELRAHMCVLAPLHQWRYTSFTQQLVDLLANRGAWLHFLEQNIVTLRADYEAFITLLLTELQSLLNHPLLNDVSPSFNHLSFYQQKCRQWFKVDGSPRKGQTQALQPEAYKVALVLAAVQDNTLLYGPICESLQVILRYLQTKLSALFQQQGSTDFQELYIGQSYQNLQLQHLLIDEFQDVSRLQYGFLQQLCHTMDPQTATVFVVGDPLQTIYQFRQAELQLFLQTQLTGLGAFRLHNLVLSVNFRTARPLVARLNAIYAQLLPAQLDPVKEQIGFTPMDAVSSSTAKFLYKRYQRSSGQWRGITRLIQQFLVRYPHHTLCVLMRARVALENLPKLLAQAQIPVNNYLTYLYDIPLIKDLALCWCLAQQPHALLFWHYLLLGDLFELQLTDIQALDLNALTTQPPACLQAYTTLFFDPTLSVTAKLQVIWAWHGTHHDPQLLHLFIQTTASLPPTAQDLTNVYHDLLQQLQETPIPVIATGARITLATIHSVKGLEFDAIVIPQAQHAPRYRTPLIQHLAVVTPARPLELFFLKDSKATQPLTALLQIRIRQATLRLMYVALTRAKRLIIVTTVIQGRSAQNSFRALLEQAHVAVDAP